MRKSKQLRFFKPPVRFFGGQNLHGRRRSSRPLSRQEAIHLVLRSSWAEGTHSFRRPENKNQIQKIIQTQAKKYGVKIYRQAIVGNHLHFILKIEHRRSYKSFIRVMSGQIASFVMNSRSFKEFKRLTLAKNRGDAHPGATEAQGKGQKFWQFRPWSRVLYWGKDFKTACDYVVQNTLEALGFIVYRPRKHRYQKWLDGIFLR